MGMSMKVEKSTVDQVKQRFQFNKKKKEEEKKQYGENYTQALLRIHTNFDSDLMITIIIVHCPR